MSLPDPTGAGLAAEAICLFDRQRREWPLAGANYAALAEVRTRAVEVDGLHFRLQSNPRRIASTGAKVDAAAIAARPCFLCDRNLPPEQRRLDVFDGAYRVLVNPFPILPMHFTIPAAGHVPQAIGPEAFAALLDLARHLGRAGLFVFYNGPKCGASAPDHLHFQAGNTGVLPIESEIEALARQYGAGASDRTGSARVLTVAAPLRPFVLIDSTDDASASAAFAACLAAWGEACGTPSTDEPMVNVLAWHAGGRTRTLLLPRTRHRPSFYDGAGDARLLLSPASIDLGGVCICPVERDFDRLTAAQLRQMLTEVCPEPPLFAQFAALLAKCLRA